MKKENVFKRTVNYYKLHIWCPFALAIFLSILVIIFILMGYLKSQYYQYLLDTTYDTERVMLDSVGINIENMLDTLIDIGSHFSVDEEIIKEVDAYVAGDGNQAYNNKLMKSILQTLSRSSSYVSGIAIVSGDGLVYQFDKNSTGSIGAKEIWDEENEAYLMEVFCNVKKNNTENQIPRYSIVIKPYIHPNMNGRGLLHIAFPMKNGYDYKNMKYMLVVSYYNQQLSSLLGQLKQGQSDDIVEGYIEASDGKILLHTQGGHFGENVYEFQTVNEFTDLDTAIGSYGWILHGAINEKLLKQKVDIIYENGMLLCTFAIVLILIILFLVTRWILKPVNIISQSIDRVKQGELQEKIAIEGSNEIWQLAQEYNEMMHSIRKANRKAEEEHGQVIETMKMKQRAEREALESQINAHFICNTLNAINYEAIDSGNYKVSVLLKKLSNILRYTFDQKHQNVYMCQEITWIDQYLYLQKERLESVFDYSIEFDSDYDNWPCRKLMLQPFVENSIIHGFEGMIAKGCIRITGLGYKEYLKIIIEDNGCGMDSERQKTIQEIIEHPIIAKEREVGIGISNVIARMKMYYGEEIQIELETKEGEGTRFTFILPNPEKA